MGNLFSFWLDLSICFILFGFTFTFKLLCFSFFLVKLHTFWNTNIYWSTVILYLKGRLDQQDGHSALFILFTKTCKVRWSFKSDVSKRHISTSQRVTAVSILNNKEVFSCPNTSSIRLHLCTVSQTERKTDLNIRFSSVFVQSECSTGQTFRFAGFRKSV